MGYKRSYKFIAGKLILSEEASIGDVSFDAYSSYIRAAGGWLVAMLVILMYFLAAGSLVFSDWWLSEWINTLTTVLFRIAFMVDDIVKTDRDKER